MDNQNTDPSGYDQLAADVAANMPAQSPIAQFKAANPAYKDVPDVQLADALHAKYYSDVPRDSFMVMAGLADAGGAMSTGMDRAAYQKRFMADNPQANQSAVDAVMAQYDQQAAARAKAQADAKTAADAKAAAIAALPPDQQAEAQAAQQFSDRLNARLQGPQDGIVPQLPSNQQPYSFADTSYHQPTLFDETAGNLVGGAFGTLIGAGAAGLRLVGDDADASDWDKARQQISADQKQRLGGDTFTGKVSNVIGSVLPALGAAPEAAAESTVQGLIEKHLANAGLFALPAFQDTYREKLAQGESKTAALIHAGEAFSLNLALPDLMQHGMGSVLGKAATEGLPGLGGVALGLGQAGAEGIGFSAASSLLDKGIDAAFGYKNDHPWLDPEDMAVQAAAFGGMRGAHTIAGIGAAALGHAQDAVRQQQLLDQIGQATNIDDAIAAASAAVSAPAGQSAQDAMQAIRPLESGPMSWAQAIGQAAPTADTSQALLGQKYVRTTNPDGSTGFALAPADPTAPDGGAPAQLGAQYLRVTNPDGSTGFSLAPNAELANSVNLPETVAAGMPAASVWRRANDPSIPTLTDNVDHLRSDIPTLNDQLAGPDGIPTLTDEVPGQVPIPTLTDVLSRPAGDGWRTFPSESGTLGIPRADMPQIRAEHRGALVNFLNARGIPHAHAELPPDSLKPTQAEFSLDKVNQAHAYEGGERSILTSSDGHVLDGHHQWLAALENNQPVKAIRLGAPIRDLLDTVREFPSVEQSDGARQSEPQNIPENIPGSGAPETALDRARAKHANQDELVRQAAENLARRKVENRAAWQRSEFAPRIEKMLGDLRAAGLGEHADMMEGGIGADARHGQLNEDKVAFREDNARQTIAKQARAEGGAMPAKVDPMTADRMGEVADAAPALPRQILDAAAKKWNPIAEQLAKMGFKYGEVHSDAPIEAQRLHRQLQDIVHALLGLAPRRYMAAKGHKNADPKKLARAEEFASQTLGIKTKRYPGVDTSNPITLGRGIVSAEERAQTGRMQAQRMRDRLKESNPFLHLIADHGVSPKDRADLGLDKGAASNPPVPGFGPVVRKTGKRLDELALHARDAGFLTDHDIESPTDTGGTRKLADMINRALAGKEVIKTPGMMEADLPSQDEKLHEEAARLGIDTTGKTAAQLYDEVAAAHRAEDDTRGDTGADTASEQSLIEDYADHVPDDVLDDARLDDADIPFDLDDPRLSSTNHFADEGNDETTGRQNEGGAREDRGLAESDAGAATREGAGRAETPGEGEVETNYAASNGDTAQRNPSPTDAELAAGRTAIKSRPFFSIDDHSWVGFKPRGEDGYGGTVRAQRFEKGKADRWDGHGHQFPIYQRDGKLYLHDEWYEPREIKQLDHPPGGEGPKDLLSSYSRDDVLARQNADETAAKQRQAERDRLEKLRKQEADDKDVRARMDASAEHFQLGQDAHDALAGQGDIFSRVAHEDPQSEQSESQTIEDNNGEKPEPLQPGQIPDLNGMFDQILAEELEAKPEQDLGDMFDAILADEQLKADRANQVEPEPVPAPAPEPTEKAKLEGMRKPREKPLADGVPLSFLKRLKVDHDVYIEDEKRWETTKVPADAALRSVRDDISNLEAMLKCMKG